jgi:putative transposase
MAKPRMDLSASIGKLLEEQDGEVLRQGIRVLSQALMETEVAGLIGAERHERTADRAAYRMRTWDTRVGTIELASPKVRPGTYFPSLLQPRRRAEHALLAVVQEAYVDGVSTRKVDERVRVPGIDGMSKSEVSRICAELDTAVEAFRARPRPRRRGSVRVGRRDVSQGACGRPSDRPGDGGRDRHQH